MTTKITVDYKNGLGDFLDQKASINITWSYQSIEHVGTFVNIYFPCTMTPQMMWEFAMEYKSFCESNNN